MADTIVDPAQSAPSAASLTDLYTVPASTTVVGSTITACNRSSTADTIRVTIAPAGAADANAQQLVFDHAIEGNGFRQWTLGFGLAVATKVRVRSANGTTSFMFFPIQRT